MKPYFVIGGEYINTEFKVLNFNTRKLLGPFDTEREAHDIWRKESWLDVDNCNCRYEIKQSLSYEDINLFNRAGVRCTVTEEMINKYSELTGDTNPVHLNSIYAKDHTLFEDRIAHGILCNSLISSVLGTQLPGPGAIYLHQSINFKKPIYKDTVIEAYVLVIEKLDKNRIKFFTNVKSVTDGELLADGEAIIMVP